MTLRTASPTDFAALSPPKGGAALRWLGQAGFLVETGGRRIVIDPYLSDSLAEKYRGERFPHTRMMPVPVQPSDLTHIDWVLCTHGHTDHMDPGTLPALMAANPQARALVPASETDKAVERGIPADRIVAIDAGETLEIEGLTVSATPAAHEALARDVNGRFLFLGYVFSCGGPTIWHSGDTIPFAGLTDLVAPKRIDLALLPINGRDATRAANGVPGNLTVDEAIDLVDTTGARSAIFHHFGMFDFNTADPVEAQRTIDQVKVRSALKLAQTDATYLMAASPPKKRRMLAVCRGNICRSPTAEALLRKHLDPAGFEIDSAALMDWNVGRAPHAVSTKVAADHGLDIAHQRARQVTQDDFRTFDVILGMDQANMTGLRALRPVDATAGLAHFGAFIETGRVQDIPDPYDFDETVFRQVFDMLDVAARRFAAWVAP